MLNNVPKQVNRASRMTVIRHPNAMPCTLWKKQVNRAPDATPETFGGMPTIGGMGVLDSEDEADYSYVELADAKIVFTDRYQGATGNMIDTENGLNYTENMREALIECLAEPGAPGWVLPDKPQVITCFPGNGVVVTYQIVGTTGNIDIHPYTRKYLLNPLNDSAEWPVAQDGSPAPTPAPADQWAGKDW